jgi:hypothetical protein
MNKYAIVTCIFDVGKRNKLGTKRNVDTYLSMFSYIADSDIPTFLFIEPELKEKIKERPGLTIIEFNLEELPNYKKLKQVEEINFLSNYKMCKEYSVVVSSKVYLISLVAKLNSEYPHLVWLDAGISHVGILDYQQLKSDIEYNISDKIVLVQVCSVSPNEIEDLKEYLSIDRFKIAAGFSIIPIKLVDWYASEIEKLYDLTINEYKLCINEEPIISVISCKNPDKFKYIYSGFRMLLNLRIPTVEINIIVKNLKYSVQNELYTNGISILEKLLAGLLQHKNYTFDDTLNTIYWGQINSYYKRNMALSKKLGYLLIYLFQNNHRTQDFFNSHIDSIAKNLAYVGLNLNMKINSDELISNRDLDYVWPLM